nr:HEPN domain-containing protein [Candidatus Freyarchaeota archaeon]
MKKEETIKALISTAERSLDAAKELFSKKHYDFSVSRAYYAMFYCAEALLFVKDMSFSKHAAVISDFGREYVKQVFFPKNFIGTCLMHSKKD